MQAGLQPRRPFLGASAGFKMQPLSQRRVCSPHALHSRHDTFHQRLFFFFLAGLQHFKGLFEGQVQVYRLTSEVGLGRG